MADPQGFLKARRAAVPKRPVAERVRDYRSVYAPSPPGHLRVQASRCMNCGVPFCTNGCPLGNLIPDWNDLVHGDQWRAAIERLSATNNFPEFTGLLCPAPCEASCVLSINDEPVTIKDIELSIVNRAFAEGWIRAQPPECRTGKRVAVIGSGPAGLAGAQQLNRAGHHVVVFEKDDKIGGLLRYGIPDFKIEKWMVDRRVDLLHEEGIEFVPGCHVGYAPTVEELQAEFDAVLLTVGALQHRDLPVPGRELAGIYPAMQYLTQQNRLVGGEEIDPGQRITAREKRVVIIGGGDTSADCLGNAHREGAASVQVLTHGPRPPASPDPLAWPDWPFVLRVYPAHEEGGERRWNLRIAGFSGSRHVERVRLQVVGATGGEPAPGTALDLEADLVLLAIGFAGPVQDRLLEELDLQFDGTGRVVADDRFHTTAPGVFVAGDAARGASLIVWAIADGRKAAREIDRHLMGSSRLPR